MCISVAPSLICSPQLHTPFVDYVNVLDDIQHHFFRALGLLNPPSSVFVLRRVQPKFFFTTTTTHRHNAYIPMRFCLSAFSVEKVLFEQYTSCDKLPMRHAPGAFPQTRRAIGLLSKNMATQRLWLHRDFNNPIVSSGASLVLFNKELRYRSLCLRKLDTTSFDIIAHQRENDKETITLCRLELLHINKHLRRVC